MLLLKLKVKCALLHDNGSWKYSSVQMIKSAYHLSELAGQNSSIVMKIPLLRKMQPDQSVPKTYFVKFRF